MIRSIYRTEVEGRNLLFVGMVTSLFIHLVMAGAWFSAMVAVKHQLATVDRLKALPLEEMRRNFQQKPPEEPPLVFVEVTPEQAVKEPPQDPKYYSSLSSKAANPDADKETNIPR